MPVDEEPAARAARAPILHRTAPALRLRSPVDVALSRAVLPVIAQRLALRATINILARVVVKRVPSIVPMGLVAAVDDRNMKLDLALQQPSQELAAAIARIGSRTFRMDPEPLLRLLQQPTGR